MLGIDKGKSFTVINKEMTKIVKTSKKIKKISKRLQSKKLKNASKKDCKTVQKKGTKPPKAIDPDKQRIREEKER